MPAFTPLPPLAPSPDSSSPPAPPPEAPSPAAPPSEVASERLVMAKELSEMFLERGVFIHYRYARALIAQCPHSVHARYVRFADAWEWWKQLPSFRPFAEKNPKARKPAKPRAFPRSLRSRSVRAT